MSEHQSKTKYILHQLKNHAPFTFIGAILGVGFMFLFREMLDNDTSEKMFMVFHPGHVVLSAMATAAMLKKHNTKIKIISLLILGYIGAVGVATLSDTVIPYASERVLGIRIDAHAHGHADEADVHAEDIHEDEADDAHAEEDIDHEEQGHVEDADHEEEADEHAIEEDGHDETEEAIHEEDDHLATADPHAGGHEGHLRLPFIEEWHIITPAALLGVLIALFWPNTKFPHFGHVLLSIWASLACVLADLGGALGIGQWIGLTIALFLAVWLPCCISDIVFPLLFVKPGEPLPKHEH